MNKYQALNKIEELIKLADSLRSEANNLYGQNNDEWKSLYRFYCNTITDLVNLRMKYNGSDYSDSYFSSHSDDVNNYLSRFENHLNNSKSTIDKIGFTYGDKNSKYFRKLESLKSGDGTDRSKIVKGFSDLLNKYKSLEPKVNKLSFDYHIKDAYLSATRHIDTLLREAAWHNINSQYETLLNQETIRYNNFVSSIENKARELNIRF